MPWGQDTVELSSTLSFISRRNARSLLPFPLVAFWILSSVPKRALQLDFFWSFLKWIVYIGGKKITKKRVMKYNRGVLNPTFPVAPRYAFCRSGWSLNLVRSGLVPWNKACSPDNCVWIASTVLFCLVEWKFGTKCFSQVPNHCRTLSGGNLNSKAKRAGLWFWLTN